MLASRFKFSLIILLAVAAASAFAEQSVQPNQADAKKFSVFNPDFLTHKWEKRVNVHVVPDGNADASQNPNVYTRIQYVGVPRWGESKKVTNLSEVTFNEKRRLNKKLALILSLPPVFVSATLGGGYVYGSLADTLQPSISSSEDFLDPSKTTLSASLVFKPSEKAPSADVVFFYRVAGSKDAWTETAPTRISGGGFLNLHLRTIKTSVSGLSYNTEYEFYPVVKDPETHAIQRESEFTLTFTSGHRKYGAVLSKRSSSSEITVQP